MNPRQSIDEVPNNEYVHKKTGGRYRLIGIGQIQSHAWIKRERKWWEKLFMLDGETVDYADVAVYQAVAYPYQIWVRPYEEFIDGRFMKVEND